MILIFDLDDTLYDESTFVRSGLKAVAKYLEQTSGLSSKQSYDKMMDLLQKKGRGRVFDDFLRASRLFSRRLVLECLSVYRHHQPAIQLYPGVRSFLKKRRKNSHLYLITDGNPIVQANKIKTLNIRPLFEKIYLTHRYGMTSAKPATHCFELIRGIEGCEFSDLCYVADDPGKDFVNINKLGIQTVRVLTGRHASTRAKPGYEADIRIASVLDLPD